MFHYTAVKHIFCEEANDGAAPGPAAGAPEATPTPAAAPAAAPAPATQTPAADQNVSEAKASWGDFNAVANGDPALAIALEWFADRGIALNDDAIAKAAEGDFDLLTAKLAALGEKGAGFERFVEIARRAHEADAKLTAENEARELALVHSVFGDGDPTAGEANWNAAKEWLSKEATPEEFSALQELFNQGGVAAAAAAHFVLNQWTSAPGVTRQSASPFAQKAGPAASPAAAGGPLSANEYAAAVRQLAAKHGGDPNRAPEEYAALRARLKG